MSTAFECKQSVSTDDSGGRMVATWCIENFVQWLDTNKAATSLHSDCFELGGTTWRLELSVKDQKHLSLCWLLNDGKLGRIYIDVMAWLLDAEGSMKSTIQRRNSAHATPPEQLEYEALDVVAPDTLSLEVLDMAEGSVRWGFDPFIELQHLFTTCIDRKTCSALTIYTRLFLMLPPDGFAHQNAMCNDMIALFKNQQYADCTLQVGKVRYALHKAILCQRSVYFQKMFEGGRMCEAQTNHIELGEDQDPQMVEVLLLYLYSGCVFLPGSHRYPCLLQHAVVDTNNNNGGGGARKPDVQSLNLLHTKNQLFLLDLYTYADRYQCCTLATWCADIIAKLPKTAENLHAVICFAERHGKTKVIDSCLEALSDEPELMRAWVKNSVLPQLAPQKPDTIFARRSDSNVDTITSLAENE